MKRIAGVGFCAFVVVAMAATSLTAAPIFGTDNNYSQDVFNCDDVYLGKIDINHYRDYKDAAKATGGVQIDGKFNSAGYTLNLHWIQAVVYDDDPLAWRGDGITLADAPYVDTPPGGYVGANNAFDYLVYYDEGEFPNFFDQPSTSLFTIKENEIASVEFETWLVCVVSENLGDNANLASDDSYEVVPLLGFEWGYTGSYLGDLAPPGDTLNDFDITKKGFDWLTTPTTAWLNALDKVYGAEDLDRYNVTIVDCGCAVPEPSTLLLAALGGCVCVLSGRGRIRKKAA